MSGEERKYPALGPGVWSVLVRNEWFKARRRLAFLVTFGLFTFIHVMEHGGDLRRARNDEDFTYALPVMGQIISLGINSLEIHHGER